MKGRADTPYGRPLIEVDDPALVGGKACNLGRMLRLGLPVPAGFVLTDAAFRAFLAAHALEAPIEALCRDLDRARPEAFAQAARAVRALVVARPIPAPVRADLATLRASLPAAAVLIVRSSAVGEDSALASFAGQLDSVPDVRDPEALEAAILACWASFWSARALAYQRARGVRLAGMGVVVQVQVAARLSGVLFTRSPDPSGGDDLLAEHCAGPGEALVSGRVTPGRLIVSRRDGRWRREPAPDEGQAPDPFFSDAGVRALAAAGLALERAFGAPQDVEWAVDGEGRLHLVQSRPITAAPARRVLWSNANVDENFPGPVSPLLYSVAAAGYSHYFRNLGRAFGVSRRRLEAMEHPLRGLIGVHGARMYYNLTNIHAVLRLAPCGRALVDAFTRFVGAPPAADGDAAPAAESGRSRLAAAAEVAVIAARTAWQYLFLTRGVARFERRADAFATRTAPAALAARPLEGLLGDLRAFLDIRFHRWTDAALADAAAMACYAVLARLLRRAFPEADAAALHNTLLKGLPDVVSGRPAEDLWALSRRVRADAELAALFAEASGAELLARLAADGPFAPFRRDLEAFLEAWGFRCPGELMLTVPSYQEDPAALVEILRSYARLDAEAPGDVRRRQDAERRAETGRVLAALRRRRCLPGVPAPAGALVAALVLRWTQRAIALRERARLKQALLYSRLRQVALAIGERLAAEGRLEGRDDVFFLTWEELDAWLVGRAMFPHHARPLVALRRAAHAELAATTPPDTLRLPEGAYLPPAGAARGGGTAPRPEALLAGVGACGGSVTGRATVLGDVAESARLAAGDVLVTRQTDPGWAPVFFLIGGLVLERGGMLSHGAILAREYGIPSVVGVRDATRLIPSGGTVTVDGDRGHVRLVA